MNNRVWLAVAILILQTTACPALSANQGWVLELTSDIAGKISLFWVKDAIRLNFHKTGLIAIAKAPSWRVQIYSDNTKKYCDFTYQQCRVKFGQKKQRESRSNRIITCNKTTRIVGLKACEYILVRADKSGEIDWRDKSEEWLTKDLNIPKPMNKLLTELSALPTNTGIPLRIIRVRNNGAKSRTIEALGYQRIAIKPETFTLPPGYKRVPDEIAVLMDEDAATLLDQEASYLSRESSKRENK